MEEPIMAERRTGYAEILYKIGGMEAKLENIYQQTLKTNGRVNTQEVELDRLREVVAEAKGSARIISAVVSTVVGLSASVMVTVLGHFWK